LAEAQFPTIDVVHERRCIARKARAMRIEAEQPGQRDVHRDADDAPEGNAPQIDRLRGESAVDAGGQKEESAGKQGVPLTGVHRRIRVDSSWRARPGVIKAQRLCQFCDATPRISCSTALVGDSRQRSSDFTYSASRLACGEHRTKVRGSPTS